MFSPGQQFRAHGLLLKFTTTWSRNLFKVSCFQHVLLVIINCCRYDKFSGEKSVIFKLQKYVVEAVLIVNT